MTDLVFNMIFLMLTITLLMFNMPFLMYIMANLMFNMTFFLISHVGLDIIKKEVFQWLMT
jgi:hypothetical protein